MKKLLSILWVALIATTAWASRTFDGTQKIYFNAHGNGATWWTDASATQRAVLDGTTSVIGIVEEGAVYAFTIPAGTYSTIRFERASSAEAAAWNATGDIVIPDEGDYVYSFAQNSTEATWKTYSSLVYNTYHIYIDNQTGWDNFYLYAWGTYEAFGAWPGATGDDLTFQVVEGGTISLNLIFHNNVGEGQEGDHRVTLSIGEARDFHLTVTNDWAGEESEIKVLSINNSLIDYNDQYAMFNSMSLAMGKDARWTKHTNLGKTLAYHFNEDPLVPNAQTVVATTPWTHIILQEQSGLPRTDFDAFRANVQTWVNYIHESCPNPNVEIILPINWAYSNDESYQTNNNTLIANYESVAQEFGLSLCPVAVAYGNYQLDRPATIASDLYSDDRHPTNAATYLACCLEYATIFAENPSSITWKPDALSDEMASRMRAYAQEAYEGTHRTEPADTTAIPETEALILTGAQEVTENFDSLGGADKDPSTDTKTGIKESSTLPQGWRIERNLNAPRQLGAFEEAATETMYIGGQALASNAYNGTWNFGATGSADRAIGGLTTGVADGTRGISLMAHLTNNSSSDFASIVLGYDIEKYRNGSNAAGFTVQLYTSANGQNWTSAGSKFTTAYTADANNNGFASVPAATTHVSDTLTSALPVNGHLFLAWNISVTSGTSCNAAPGLAIDNVSFRPLVKETTALDPATQPDTKAAKILPNGQLFILRDGKKYNALGTEVK